MVEIIKELNKNLPANVYIPIKTRSLKFKQKSKKATKSANQ